MNVSYRTVSILAFCGLLALSAGTTRAQESEQANRYVQSEIAKFPRGKYLYEHSEVFEHLIERHLAESESRMEQATLNESSKSRLAIEENTRPALDLSNSSIFQSEAFPIISRTNPTLMIVGANDEQMFTQGMPAYVTQNAGKTWNTIRLPMGQIPGYQPGGDPILACDNVGTIYYSYLVYGPMDSNKQMLSDIQLARTTDGIHWKLCAPVIGRLEPDSYLEDKESIAIDQINGSPYYGRIYVTWMHFALGQDGSTNPRIAYSDDQGASWSSPVDLDPLTGLFPTIRIGQLGEVLIASSAETDHDNYQSMLISQDGGRTFRTRHIATFHQYPLNQEGHSSLKGSKGFRAFPYFTFDIDHYWNAFHGVYGSWNDSLKIAEQFYIYSTDDGVSWTKPYPIGNRTGASTDRFFPWITFDPASRLARICYYSSEEDSLNTRCRLMQIVVNLPDGVHTIGSTLFNPLACVARTGESFIGDYVGADSWNGYFLTTWAENHAGSSDADVFAYVTTPSSSVGSSTTINTTALKILNFHPNPVSTDRATLSISLEQTEAVTIDVLDEAGAIVRHFDPKQYAAGVSDLDLDVKGLASGTYMCRMSTSRQTASRNFVVQR